MNRQTLCTLSFILILATILFLFSCTSNEIGNSKDVNPEAVYFDYEIWAKEGSEDVSINLQYRMGGPNGTTLVLDSPSKVAFDGEALQPDSAKFSGAYYETQKPFALFQGNHSIVFTDLNNKEYKEEFDFIPFTIEPDLPVVFKRGDLILNIKGLEPVDYIRVLATDTSFTSEDINEVDTVKNGRLIIPAQKIALLKNGPINLELFKESEKSLKNLSKEGGRLLINYSIKREFELNNGSKN